ncbi:1148_t:CDS:10 [Diversispora eburnea]|uniref:1148_t:CDS:1 n=1 Tax=Diversispora eburnea TaxID=1213867 RepID=A0A9N9C8R7_9GLOM|nr:1148_t:CDS:10 [Diversispora eburnea]
MSSQYKISQIVGEKYFTSTPTSDWSYSGYLEAVEHCINNSTRLSALKSLWRKRFNEHLREIEKDRSDEEKCTIATTLLIQDSKATEFWNRFEKKRTLKQQQYDTNVEIQLNTLKVMSTASSYQRNELSKQMENSGDNDKNLKRQNDDYIEKENSKSCKVEDSGVKKQEKEKGNNLNDNDHSQVKNLLNELRSSEKMKNLVECFQKYCNESVNELTKNEIMDLTPSSEFVLRYTDEDDYMQVLRETFESVDELFPESAIKFLNEFFSETCTHEQWDDKLESLLEPEEDQFLKKLKRLLFETLPIFFDAFSMLYDNPLKNHNMLEEEGNKAVQASAYRKLVMRQEGYTDRSDGLAYIITEKQYEICVIEGSRPYVVDDTKEMSDFVQNARAGKDIINYTVVSEVKLKRAPPLQFKAYMVQSIGLSLRFYFMDYLGKYRLFEIETCEIPTDLEGVDLFPSFFKAVVTWALMVRDTDQEFRTVRNRRSARYSNAHNLRVLSEISHNKPRTGNTKIIKEKKII